CRDDPPSGNILRGAIRVLDPDFDAMLASPRSMRLHSLVLAALVALGAGRAAISPAPAGAESLRITVLHPTDLHGALTDYDYLADRPAKRGLVRIATLVRAARAENPNLLLLDAGDCIQGGGIETVYQHRTRERPEPMMAAMSRMGYDAMAVGNHEFDFRPEAVERARRDARFPWLAADIVRASNGAPAFPPSIVRTLGGGK